MYGGEDRRYPEGAISFSADSLEIASAVPYVIDGEFFDPPEGEALRVETGPVLTYLRG